MGEWVPKKQKKGERVSFPFNDGVQLPKELI
jgi:hypothetical protein